MGRAEIKLPSASVGIKTENIFSALRQTSSSSGPFKKQVEQKPAVPAWTLRPISSWADYEDEDDDEFFSCVSPLPSVLHPIREEKSFLETVQEEDEDEEEEEKEENAAEDQRLDASPRLLQVQKPKIATAPNSKPTLSKKEQRRRELAEMDSVQKKKTLPLKQSPAKVDQQEQHRSGSWFSSQDSSAKAKASSTNYTEKRSCKPKKELKPLAQLAEVDVEDGRGAIDHAALRKVAAEISVKGNKRNSGCAASSSLACKAAVAEASARAVKVEAAKRKDRSKQQNHFH